MIYEVLFDLRVYELDFRPIDVGNQQRIVEEVRRKLSVAPDRFGKPFGKGTAGLSAFTSWRLPGYLSC